MFWEHMQKYVSPDKQYLCLNEHAARFSSALLTPEPLHLSTLSHWQEPAVRCGEHYNDCQSYLSHQPYRIDWSLLPAASRQSVIDH